MPLTVYGDFNCPYSRLASNRVDELIERGTPVDWRAVQHDTSMPRTGVTMEGEARAKIAREIEEIRSMLRDGEVAGLEIPDVRPNTARASERYAALDGEAADAFRRGYFDAVWNGGAVPEPFGTEDTERARTWQQEWESFDDRLVPLLVEGETVHRGKGALERLAVLLAEAPDG